MAGECQSKKKRAENLALAGSSRKNAQSNRKACYHPATGEDAKASDVAANTNTHHQIPSTSIVAIAGPPHRATEEMPLTPGEKIPYHDVSSLQLTLCLQWDTPCRVSATCATISTTDFFARPCLSYPRCRAHSAFHASTRVMQMGSRLHLSFA